MREIATSNCLSYFLRELILQSILIHPQYVFIEYSQKIPTSTALEIRETVLHKMLKSMPLWNLHLDKGKQK